MMNNTHPETEKALLGGILLHSERIYKYMNYLSKELFFDKKNILLFNTISYITQKNEQPKIEISYLVDLLNKEKSVKNFDWQEYISDLINDGCDERNIIPLSKSLDDLTQIRLLEKTTTSILKTINTSHKKSSEELIGLIEQKIFDVTKNKKVKDFENASKIARETIDAIVKKVGISGPSGITSGFKNIDDFTGGFQKSDLIILAARPSMGKTALALNFAYNAAKKNHVALVSLEMSSKQLMERVLGTTALIDFSLLKNPSRMSDRDWVKLDTAKSHIDNISLSIDDTPGVLLGELIWKVRKLNKIKKIDLLIIDYLQLITIKSNYSSDNRQMEVSTISRNLKFLAKELNIPIIALSQLSRKVEQRENKKPMMSDIRESGAIEQDADIIMFLYREEYYRKREEQTESEETSQHDETELIIAKHRNGPIGTANLLFKSNTGLFSDLEKKQ